MKNSLMVLLALLLAATPALGFDLTKRDSSSQKVEEDISQMWKRHMDNRESEGRRQSDTWSQGRDTQSQTSERSSGQQSRSGQLDIAISPEVAFADRLRALEQSGQQPFAMCSVISRPRLARDFGLSAEIRPGVIDTIKAGYLSQAAQSNAPVSSLANEQALKYYRDCLAIYGALVRDAFMFLSQDLEAIDAGLVKDQRGIVQIQGLGYRDFRELAAGALDRALDELFFDLDDFANYLTDDPCRFEGRPEAIQCGPVLMTLGTRPELTTPAMTIYGRDPGGISGTYRISSSWSYSDALERMKSSSEFARFAEDVSKYVEEAESLGMSREAAMAKKKAVDLAASADASLSTAPFFRGFMPQ